MLQFHWFFPLLMGLHGTLAATTGGAKNCKPNEFCVLERACIYDDDAGRGKIGPRIDQVCGPQRVCCDGRLLGIDTSGIEDRLNVGDTTTPSTQVSTAPQVPTTKKTYATCGPNKECIERHLCNGTINDSGRYIIASVGVRSDGSDDNFGCRALEKCCDLEDELTENPYLKSEFKYKGCGYSNPKGLYIDLVGYNNNEATFGEFPWVVAIMGARSRYLCGGTLIHPSVVLTAAHCIQNLTVDSLVLRAGEWDMSGELEPLPHQNRRVRDMIVHEDFDSLAFFNDLAILVVSEPFELKPHIQPICLPERATPQVFTRFRKEECYAAGWGQKNYDNEKHTQKILKRIDLPVVQHGECEESLRQTILGRRFRLRPSFLCAGGEPGRDTCKGDGGSPLFCTIGPSLNNQNDEDRFVLAGLVSWGISCGVDGIPGVYVNIPHLREWIDTNLAKLKITIDAQ